jgi:ribonuclease G
MVIKTQKQIKKEIVANVESLETRIAFLEDGRLEDFFVERKSEERIVGSIFKGRIQNLEDGLQAAFVDIGLKKNAFIHYWDMIPEDAARLEAEEVDSSNGRSARKKKFQPGEMLKRFPIGTEIIVQVSKAAISTKGPRVTANLSIAGRYLVMMPGSRLKGVSRKISGDKERNRLKKILGRMSTPEDLGFIIRTAGEGARKTAFARDLRGLLDCWEQIDDGIKNKKTPCQLYQEPDLLERLVRDSLIEDIDRIVIDSEEEAERVRKAISRIARNAQRNIKVYDGSTPIFEHFDIERQLQNAFRRKVWLPGGGYLVFDETEALVAIDINTGRHKGGNSQEESILEVNLEAAEEIARQLRLRNVGGLVVIDFIDMKQRKNRQAVYRRLREGVRIDKARTNLLPISDLGLLEMTRQRAKESISSAAYVDCPYCKGRGTVKSALTMSVEVQRHIHEVLRKLQNEGKDLATRITVHPIVMERLRRTDETLLVELEEKYGGHMAFVSDGHLHVEEFVISNPETHETYYSNIDQGRVHLQLD